MTKRARVGSASQTVVCPPAAPVTVSVVLMLVVPVAFFPYSKTLFLAFDLLVRPPTEEDFTVPHEEARNVRRRQT